MVVSMGDMDWEVWKEEKIEVLIKHQKRIGGKGGSLHHEPSVQKGKKR